MHRIGKGWRGAGAGQRSAGAASRRRCRPGWIGRSESPRGQSGLRLLAEMTTSLRPGGSEAHVEFNALLASRLATSEPSLEGRLGFAGGAPGEKAFNADILVKELPVNAFTRPIKRQVPFCWGQ